MGMRVILNTLFFFFFCILQCFEILGPWLAGDRLHLHGWLIPLASKQLAREYSFHMKTSQSTAHITDHLLYPTHTLS